MKVFRISISFMAVLVLFVPVCAFSSVSEIERDFRKDFGNDGLALLRSFDGSESADDIMKKRGLPASQREAIFLWLKEKATAMNKHSMDFYAAKKPEKAIPYAEQALGVTEKALGKYHPAVTKSLNYLADLYKLTNDLPKAERAYARTAEIFEKSYGRKHYLVAEALNNLAQAYSISGKYKEAEPVYKEVLLIYENQYGKEHPAVVNTINNIALLLDTTGRLSEAEPYYKEAVSLSKKVYGENHPAVASSMNNLGLLYYSTGKYKEAEPLYKKALSVYESIYCADNAPCGHPAVATAYNNLALLYTANGNFAEAEKYYKKAVKMDKETHGEEHGNVMSDINNLANLYKETGKYGEAEMLYKQAIEIGRKKIGDNNPAMAPAYNNLAMLYYLKGRLADAKPLFEKSIAIVKKTLGENHPDLALWTGNLAMLQAAENNHASSFATFKKSLSLEYERRRDVFYLLPEEQRLIYMKRNEGTMHAFLSLAALHFGRDVKSSSSALDEWLKWKGAVMETQLRYMSSEAPAVKKKIEDLLSIKREIAKLKLDGPAGSSSADYQNALSGLENRKEKLETDLLKLSKDFAVEKEADDITAGKIASFLDADSVYIDFAYIRSYDFKNRSPGELKYIAFVISSSPHSVWIIDLGGAAEINKRINLYLEEIKSPVIFGELPRLDLLSEDATILHKRLIQPISAHLKGKKNIFISPDGNLNLFPFEVLLDPKGKYLIEDFRISYVTTGRDIVRFSSGFKTNRSVFIFSDPDYNARVMQKSMPRGGISKDNLSLRFSELPDTKIEADRIENRLKNKNYTVYSYRGKEATEDALFKAASPGILHLATHGYFLKDVIGDKNTELKSGTSNAPGPENPMYRSGIALAGANTSLKDGKEYGIVSADKTMGLKLKGTELVVLSACDTGVGDLQRGEGVFGLKRAFILAGAKSLVMSLWGVPSAETSDIMTDFYERLASGTPKAEALRLARMATLKEKGNPFYWGAFVLIGNPR